VLPLIFIVIVPVTLHALDMQMDVEMDVQMASAVREPVRGLGQAHFRSRLAGPVLG
jgi:hypothetical protein